MSPPTSKGTPQPISAWISPASQKAMIPKKEETKLLSPDAVTEFFLRHLPKERLVYDPRLHTNGKPPSISGGPTLTRDNGCIASFDLATTRRLVYEGGHLKIDGGIALQDTQLSGFLLTARLVMLVVIDKLGDDEIKAMFNEAAYTGTILIVRRG